MNVCLIKGCFLSVYLYLAYLIPEIIARTVVANETKRIKIQSTKVTLIQVEHRPLWRQKRTDRLRTRPRTTSTRDSPRDSCSAVVAMFACKGWNVRQGDDVRLTLGENLTSPTEYCDEGSDDVSRLCDVVAADDDDVDCAPFIAALSDAKQRDCVEHTFVSS